MRIHQRHISQILTFIIVLVMHSISLRGTLTISNLISGFDLERLPKNGLKLGRKGSRSSRTVRNIDAYRGLRELTRIPRRPLWFDSCDL
jgi:hypothetical protein